MIKQFVGKALYAMIGKHLPESFSRVQIGQKKFRAFCARLFIAEAGKNINIEKGAVFSRYLKIGDNSGIGINAEINGEVEIGGDVMMGADCVIYTRNHAHSRTDVPMNTQGFEENRKVTIGDDVWIGGRVIILPGVTVGSHSIIGAGSVVTKDVPPFAVVAGNPAKVVKHRQ